MSTSPMAARECWIYGECLKIRMMVPGAAAPGKQPGKHYTVQSRRHSPPSEANTFPLLTNLSGNAEHLNILLFT